MFCLFISYMWLLQQSRERDKEEKCLETWTPNSFTGSSGSWTAHMTLEFGLPHWNACTGTMFESAGIHFINNLWTGLWPTDYCSNAVTCNGATVFVIKGFTVVRGETPDQELWGFYLESFIIINQYSLKVSLSSEFIV